MLIAKRGGAGAGSSSLSRLRLSFLIMVRVKVQEYALSPPSIASSKLCLTSSVTMASFRRARSITVGIPDRV